MNEIISKLLSTRSRNRATLPIRLAAGLVFMGHGAQKLFGWFGGNGLQATAGFFADKLHLTPGIFWATLAGCGEFFGGLALFVGIATRFFGFVTAVTMAVAIITVHSGAFFMQAGGMEYALTLLLVSISLIISGGGAFSVDALIAGKSCRGAGTETK